MVSTVAWILSLWGLYVLPVYVGVSSGCSCFLPQYKSMHVRLIDQSTLPLSVDVFFSLCVAL